MIGGPVLMLRLDVDAFDFHLTPHLGRELTVRQLDAAVEDVRAAGFRPVACEVPAQPDAAGALLRERLRGADYGDVVFSPGLRLYPRHTEVFERLINVTRHTRPAARLRFASDTTDALRALRRTLPDTDSGPPAPPRPGKPRRVLIVRIDPDALDYADLPGVDAFTLHQRYQHTEPLLRAAGFDPVTCLTGSDVEDSADLLCRHFAKRQFDAALIGGTLRMFPRYTVLFERVVHIVGQAAPAIPVAFSTSPESALTAVHRIAG